MSTCEDFDLLNETESSQESFRNSIVYNFLQSLGYNVAVIVFTIFTIGLFGLFLYGLWFFLTIKYVLFFIAMSVYTLIILGSGITGVINAIQKNEDELYIPVILCVQIIFFSMVTFSVWKIVESDNEIFPDKDDPFHVTLGVRWYSWIYINVGIFIANFVLSIVQGAYSTNIYFVNRNSIEEH